MNSIAEGKIFYEKYRAMAQKHESAAKGYCDDENALPGRHKGQA